MTFPAAGCRLRNAEKEEKTFVGSILIAFFHKYVYCCFHYLFSESLIHEVAASWLSILGVTSEVGLFALEIVQQPGVILT